MISQALKSVGFRPSQSCFTRFCTCVFHLQSARRFLVLFDSKDFGIQLTDMHGVLQVSPTFLNPPFGRDSRNITGDPYYSVRTLFFFTYVALVSILQSSRQGSISFLEDWS